MPKYPRRGQGVPCVCCLHPDARYPYPVEGDRQTVPVCGWCKRLLAKEAAVGPTGAPAVVFTEGGLHLATQEVLDRVARKRGKDPGATTFTSTRAQLQQKRTAAAGAPTDRKAPRSPRKAPSWRPVGDQAGQAVGAPPSAGGPLEAMGTTPRVVRQARASGAGLRERIHLSSSGGSASSRALSRLEALLNNTRPAVLTALLGRVSRDALAAGLYAAQSGDLLPEETCAYVASLLEAQRAFDERLEETLNELHTEWIAVLKEHGVPLPRGEA